MYLLKYLNRFMSVLILIILTNLIEDLTGNLLKTTQKDLISEQNYLKLNIIKN